MLDEVRRTGPTFVVDAGDLLFKPKRLSDSERPQRRVKADLQLRAYAESGIDAMVMGEGDLRLGLDWLGQRIRDLSLPVVFTNATCDGLDAPSYRVVERDGLTLGFVGVLGHENVGPCTFRMAVPALKTAIAEMGAVDLVILLSHQDPKEDAGLVEAVSGIGLVVNGHGRRTIKMPRPLGESALQLSTGTRGKKLGVAAVVLVQGGEGFSIEGATAEIESKLKRAQNRLKKSRLDSQADCDENCQDAVARRIRRLSKQVDELQSEIEASEQMSAQTRHRIHSRLRPLSDEVSEHPNINAMVQSAKPKIEAAAAKLTPPKRASQSVFVGSRACQACHGAQHAHWKATPHAYAWATLEGVGRSKDLQCWSCHVTGAHHDEGPQHPSQAVGLENVGCESCHGPGAAHVQSPAKTNIHRRPELETCTQCHDGIKDEGRFRPDEYMTQVEH